MKKLKKKSKKKLKILILGLILLAGVFFITFPFIFYLKILPAIVSNPKFIGYTQDFVKQQIGANLTLKSPELKTSLSPIIDLNAEEFSLSKDGKYILSVKSFKSDISIRRVFKHTIDLRKVGADSLFVDVNKLLAILPKQKKEQKKSDWTVNWLDSILYLNKCYILDNPTVKTKIRVRGKDISITSSRNPKKVHFKFKIDVNQKGLPPVKIGLWDKNKVYIENHKIYLDEFLFFVNRSPLFVRAVADEHKHYDITVHSPKFELKNIVNLINSNLIVKNGSLMLSSFKDIDGKFKFRIHLSNTDMSGQVSIINCKFKVIPVKNLPISIASGNILINKKDIFFNNFNGYYANNSKRNVFDVNGSAKNYLKSVNIIAIAKGKITNEFMQDYVTPMAKCSIKLIGDAKSYALIKINSKAVDIKCLSKIEKQGNILIAGASITPKGWDRALVADMHFGLADNILNIKSLNYYIAKEITEKTKYKNPIIVSMKGRVDCKKAKVLTMGFLIPHALPSEFMNLFVGNDFFKKGTVGGHLTYINTERVPRLEGQIQLLKVRVPSQRLKIKDGKIITDKKHIHIIALGRYRRSGYKLDGEIKNEMVFPVVVKDANLTVEKLDVEKVLKTFNSNSTTESSNTVAPALVQTDIISYNDNEPESEANVYTFPPNLLVVEKCMLHVLEGHYKDIDFGNMHADLTLTRKGILQVISNKFDFAKGGASTKVYCDLMKHKYSVLIAARKVDADVIASNLLGLKKEITGLAGSTINLYTDDSMKMNGTIRFQVKKGTISKLGVIEYILKVAALFRNPLAMISPSTFVDLVNMPEGTFDKIIGTIDLKNNVAENITIKSASPQLSSYIAGRFNLETRDSSLRIYTKFSNKGKGFLGFLRNLSLNTILHTVSTKNQNIATYYASEISQIPTLKTGEKTAQIFLTTVEGDVEHNNFISSLKKIK